MAMGPGPLEALRSKGRLWCPWLFSPVWVKECTALTLLSFAPPQIHLPWTPRPCSCCGSLPGKARAYQVRLHLPRRSTRQTPATGEWIPATKPFRSWPVALHWGISLRNRGESGLWGLGLRLFPLVMCVIPSDSAKIKGEFSLVSVVLVLPEY